MENIFKTIQNPPNATLSTFFSSFNLGELKKVLSDVFGGL